MSQSDTQTLENHNYSTDKSATESKLFPSYVLPHLACQEKKSSRDELHVHFEKRLNETKKVYELSHNNSYGYTTTKYRKNERESKGKALNDVYNKHIYKEGYEKCPPLTWRVLVWFVILKGQMSDVFIIDLRLKIKLLYLISLLYRKKYSQIS